MTPLFPHIDPAKGPFGPFLGPFFSLVYDRFRELFPSLPMLFSRLSFLFWVSRPFFWSVSSFFCWVFSSYRLFVFSSFSSFGLLGFGSAFLILQSFLSLFPFLPASETYVLMQTHVADVKTMNGPFSGFLSPTARFLRVTSASRTRWLSLVRAFLPLTQHGPCFFLTQA